MRRRRLAGARGGGYALPGSGRSLAVAHQPEDRMLGRGPAHLLVRRVRSGPVEEGADLGFPAFEVGAQDRWLLCVGHLDRAERLGPPSEQQPALAAGSKVAHPLGVAAWRHEVSLAIEL